jgi:hypothetical protein
VICKSIPTYGKYEKIERGFGIKMNEKMKERLFLSSFSQSILKDKKSQFKRLRDKYLYVIHKKN